MGLRLEELAARIGSLDWFVAVEGWEERNDQLVEEHLAALTEAYFARGSQRLEGLRNWAAGRATPPDSSSNTDE